MVWAHHQIDAEIDTLTMNPFGQARSLRPGELAQASVMGALCAAAAIIAVVLPHAGALGLLGAAGTIVVFLACLRSWRDRQAWFWSKVWNLAILLACLGFVWFGYYWNLMNFNMNY